MRCGCGCGCDCGSGAERLLGRVLVERGGLFVRRYGCRRCCRELVLCRSRAAAGGRPVAVVVVVVVAPARAGRVGVQGQTAREPEVVAPGPLGGGRGREGSRGGGIAVGEIVERGASLRGRQGGGGWHGCFFRSK